MNLLHPSLRTAARMSTPAAGAAPRAQRAAAAAAGHTTHSAAAFTTAATSRDTQNGSMSGGVRDSAGIPPPQPGRLFTFGICTDVQYADLPQGFSHGGTARYYRDSLNGLQRAVASWKDRGVEFGMHLGDLVDGKNPKDRRQKALADVLGVFNQLEKPVYHMIGNHCLYNFSREELNSQLGVGRPDGGSHYSFSPHPRWRFVVIDSYDISMLGWPAEHEKHQAAKQTLDRENINEEKNSPDGMRGVQRRFVKFGGGMSNEQLDWLRAQLAAAKDEDQRVVVFCHQPLHPDSCTGTTLAWTYAEVMEILQQAGNVVAAFAGHTHQDGYARDKAGIHYRALSAILETPPGHDCFGFIDVYEDRLDLIGVGPLDSIVMHFEQEPATADAQPAVQRQLA